MATLQPVRFQQLRLCKYLHLIVFQKPPICGAFVWVTASTFKKWATSQCIARKRAEIHTRS